MEFWRKSEMERNYESSEELRKPSEELKKYGEIMDIYLDGKDNKNLMDCYEADSQLHFFKCENVGMNTKRFMAYKVLTDFLDQNINKTIEDLEEE